MRASTIWQLFRREADKAKCLFCNKRLVVRKRSTGNLIQHVKSLHSDEYKKFVSNNHKTGREQQKIDSQEYDNSDELSIIDPGERKYQLGGSYRDVNEEIETNQSIYDSEHAEDLDSNTTEDVSDFDSEEDEISRVDMVISLLDRSSAHAMFMNRLFNTFPAGLKNPSQEQLIFCFDVISAIFNNKLKTTNLEACVIKSDSGLIKEIALSSNPNLRLMRKLKNLTWKAIINVVRRSYQTLQSGEEEDGYDKNVEKLRTFAERKKINFEKLSSMLKNPTADLCKFTYNVIKTITGKCIDEDTLCGFVILQENELIARISDCSNADSALHIMQELSPLTWLAVSNLIHIYT